MQTRKEDRRSCHNASFIIIGLLAAARDLSSLQTANTLFASMLVCVKPMVHLNEMRWN